MRNVSIIVGCMGRRLEAEQFVPHMAALLSPGDEIVVVDWDDPGKVSEYCAGLKSPFVTCVRVEPCCWFEANRQRNVGAWYAVNELLVVADIDKLWPSKLLAECRELKAGEFLVQECSTGSIGWLCCRWTDWRAVNGYEESLSGYGYDDFYHRESLNHFGLKMIVSQNCVWSVPREVGSRAYPDEARTTSHHVNMRIGKACRIYHPWKGNYARNFGSGGVVVCESEARKNAGETRPGLSAARWRG